MCEEADLPTLENLGMLGPLFLEPFNNCTNSYQNDQYLAVGKV
jgi:hypothetical protein